MALRKVPAWSHILVYPTISIIIPEYVPVRVYQTITSEGYDWNQQLALSYRFFRGDMPWEDLHRLLTDNKISYVFYGPEEKRNTVTPTFYPDVLEIMYQNPEVTIYKVRPLQ
jgi:hypothetical protein